MSAPRRVSGMALLVAISVGVMGGAIAMAVFCSNGSKTVVTGPKAMVDQTPWVLGRIESGVEFGHTFTVRNDGDAPLQLAQGPKLCSCMVAGVPDKPVSPGQQAKIKLVAADSVKNEPMNAGPFSRSMHLLTNDPDQPDIVLQINATVVPRMSAVPSQATLAIDSSKSAAQQQRSVETYVYSERWDRFDLSAGKTSRRDIQSRIEPVTAEKLHEFKARSGYRVLVTLPPEMADGRFAEWIELAGRSADGKTASCRFDIQGRVEGRLTFFGAKVIGGNVLQLGTLAQGQRVCETLLMKVSDQRRRLVAERIDAEPAFLHARLVPYAGGAKQLGLYRIEVEIPTDAPSGAFTGAHRGVIRLKTDHPRLPLIELKVDFVVAAGSAGAAHVAAR